MWKGNPALTSVLFGLPMGFFALICYSICCADIMDADEEDEDELNYSHEKTDWEKKKYLRSIHFKINPFSFLPSKSISSWEEKTSFSPIFCTLQSVEQWLYHLWILSKIRKKSLPNQGSKIQDEILLGGKNENRLILELQVLEDYSVCLAHRIPQPIPKLWSMNLKFSWLL